MPEDEKKEEKQEQTQGNPKEAQGPVPSPVEGNPNGAPTAEDLAVIKAELEEEKKAKAAVEATLAESDKRIAELRASLKVVQQASEAAATELSQVKEAHAKAVSKYLEAARALNPNIPKDVIVGGTIDEIDVSLAKAKSIAESVKKVLEAQAKEAKVPAGAPTRGEISLEGLSPREKISAGIMQK